MDLTRNKPKKARGKQPIKASVPVPKQPSTSTNPHATSSKRLKTEYVDHTPTISMTNPTCSSCYGQRCNLVRWLSGGLFNKLPDASRFIVPPNHQDTKLLNKVDLRLATATGDGRCLWHAISVSLLGNESPTTSLKAQTLKALHENKDHYLNLYQPPNSNLSKKV